MTVADYVLAVVGGLLTLAAAGLAFMVAMSGGFVPTPDEETKRTSRQGCGWFVALVVLFAWLAGVVWHGSWGWAA